MMRLCFKLRDNVQDFQTFLGLRQDWRGEQDELEEEYLEDHLVELLPLVDELLYDSGSKVTANC